MKGDTYVTESGLRFPDLHGDDVQEAAGALLLHLGLAGAYSVDEVRDAVAVAILTWRAADERRVIRERAADRRAGIIRRIRQEYGDGDPKQDRIDAILEHERERWGAAQGEGGHS